jgi:uncharacterized membrane protein
MKRSALILGLLLLMAVDTIVQIGFKFAGDAALPVTLDLPWLQRVMEQPWVYVVIAGYGGSFAIYMTLIRHAAVGPVFAASHLEIVAVTLFSVHFLGDRLNLLQAIGCCCIVTGVLVLAATEAEAGGEQASPSG